MNESIITQIEQGRASFAYSCAKKNISKEYRSYVKKLPMLIKTNGLGATLAFMYSKKGTYEIIGQDIINWLKQDTKKLIHMGSIKEFGDLVNKVIELDSYTYKALTMEVLAFLNWLRRFADGLYKEEKTTSEGDKN